jgi:hypothetical protein
MRAVFGLNIRIARRLSSNRSDFGRVSAPVIDSGVMFL